MNNLHLVKNLSLFKYLDVYPGIIVYVFFLFLMQNLPSRAPDLLWLLLYSQSFLLCFCLYFLLWEILGYFQKFLWVFYIQSVIICIYYLYFCNPTPNTDSDGHWEHENFSGGTSCCFTEGFFSSLSGFLPGRSMPQPLHPGLTLPFLIFLMSSISFSMSEEFCFPLVVLDATPSFFYLSLLYFRSMDGLGEAWFTEAHLGLLIGARWVGDGNCVSGVHWNKLHIHSEALSLLRQALCGRKVILSLWP